MYETLRVIQINGWDEMKLMGWDEGQEDSGADSALA